MVGWHRIKFYVATAPLAVTFIGKFGIIQPGFVETAALACTHPILVLLDVRTVVQVLTQLRREQYLAPHVNRIRSRFLYVKTAPLAFTIQMFSGLHVFLVVHSGFLAAHVYWIGGRGIATSMKIRVCVMLDLDSVLPETARCVLQGNSNYILEIRSVNHVTQMHGRFRAARHVRVMQAFLDKMTDRVLCVDQENTKELLVLPQPVSRAL